MSDKQKGAAQPEILSGWKDIANHLGMGVRTVQRYARELSLPVRRLSGKATGPVVSTKADLDSWVKSSATAQESINIAQKLLNVKQGSFNVETRSTENRLVSEIARGLQDRAELQAQMTELRSELRIELRSLRENLLKLRQELSAMRRRQDFIASAIKDYSKVRALLSVRGKRQRPN